MQWSKAKLPRDGSRGSIRAFVDAEGDLEEAREKLRRQDFSERTRLIGDAPCSASKGPSDEMGAEIAFHRQMPDLRAPPPM